MLRYETQGNKIQGGRSQWIDSWFPLPGSSSSSSSSAKSVAISSSSNPSSNIPSAMLMASPAVSAMSSSSESVRFASMATESSGQMAPKASMAARRKKLLVSEGASAATCGH